MMFQPLGALEVLKSNASSKRPLYW